MARRGCYVDMLHFSVTEPSEEELKRNKVVELARRLAGYTLGARLFIVPYTYFDMALLRKPTAYQLVLFRRFLLRTAERLAGQIEAEALVTGDSLSQVASQTLSNLVATSRAVQMPIFRPLIGMDKEEIVQLAKQIGTYDLSTLPYKDCCALISRHPKTRSQHDRLVEIERQIFPDYEALIQKTLAAAKTVWVEPPPLEETEGPEHMPIPADSSQTEFTDG